MKETVLEVRNIPPLGIEAEVITPDIFQGKTLDGIRNLPIYEGKTRIKLGDCFTVKGAVAEKKQDMRITIKGDVSGVKRIGQEISAGEIEICGDAGIYLGCGMMGGKIRVKGDASSWTGMDMCGGRIEIMGDAGNFLGSAYRGKWKGMSGGEILVRGNAGSNVGSYMAAGKIAIGGDAGQFLGIRMSGGQIMVDGCVDSRVGAEMMKGVIIVKGEVKEMLPSFMKKGEVGKVLFDGVEIKGEYTEYLGDVAEGGKGSMYIRRPKLD